jgi:D-methionine transport system permease protein
MSPQMIDRLWQAAFDTMFMVGVSAGIAVVAGIPLALFLVTSGPGGIFPAPPANRLVGLVVNGFRAVPFIVLLVALIPFTRLVVGTTIGVWAAIVPLAVSATPFFARIAEVSLREVDPGLVEAAQSIGCRRRHILLHVLLPEALPGIVGGFTITVVSMIGASAVAGAGGAGGRGAVGIRYGYQILIVLVCLVQFTGDSVVRRLRAR